MTPTKPWNSVMSAPSVDLYFNFRSPYCYLISHSIFERLANYKTQLHFYPLGGWDGRSPPERAKVKVPLTRQDVKRWCKRLGVPFNPPPITTDPTPAALVSIAAGECGQLEPYVKQVMWQEWAEGQDIGQTEVLSKVAVSAGLEEGVVEHALTSAQYKLQLQENWARASDAGVIGVPTFVVGEEIFWGNDRMDFVEEYLEELGLKA